MKRLAIIITHPIQYYVPVFQLLAEICHLNVFYTWGKAGAKPKYDPDFGKEIEWDIPLLAGYDYEFLENHAKDPGSHHFQGIRNVTITERIKEFNPDAILVYGWAYSSHLKILRHFHGKVPVWFRGDSNLLDCSPKWKSAIKHIYLSWVYSNVDVAFNVGQANKAYYIKTGLQENQLAFAPHAVDNARFSADRKEEAQEFRQTLKIPKEKILILFAGKFEAKKDPELLLEAFSVLNQLDACLLFVGNGALETKLKARVAALHLQTKVVFSDFQNQTAMPVVYQACDLFCLPSCGPGETWGLAVNEAMASGKAVLVSDKVGCALDLIVAGKNGFVFKSGNKKDLVNRLRELCKSKEDLIKKGMYSKAIISKWSFEKQVEVIINQLNKQ